ncbi:MAG: phosphate ABC transporter substrate-binding protein PstS, partial [Nitrosopumilaceae archaeon]|nr:phosphate ABC transporter substrate-binding protein PstS [Nitrosopumilaceae archaeon]NIU01299.1 phosphate ABC transporter substrate-binding protein PstS [Nitrosopumilaceae archaeon]NIU87649.1 phosphate ABC transporter substrate-binding protein PstS [Nitrosopumilaceae archaeon]NIV66073.1 phosphate ABC transporter substrate-binding protein PstS [Nitrosopumilaceae archaeon]NIX61901.1 phosphate ABC transporter substrate-binding protein PstS [Nitrosopumilaceae archaeon]
MRTKITSLLLIATLVAIIPPINAEAAQTPDLPTSEREFNINAAGATFPFPLIDLWRVEYNNQYSNVNLNYQSIGSGGGIKQHIEKTVNFAASDKPLSESELENAPGTLHIPEAIGGVVVAYNIPEVPDKGLKLTGSVIADIYLGQITKWNDSRITELNPDLSLPDKEIIVAHRSDGSGTTFVFTDYLTKISSEFDKQVGAGKSVPWGDVSGDPTLVAAAGNEGVAGIIRSTDYSLGYIELAYAFQTGMSYAFIQNGDGTAFIEPTLESISAASSGVADNLPNASDSWNGVSLVNAPGSE